MKRQLSEHEITPIIRRQLIGHLSTFVLEKRLDLFHSILNNRTQYVSIVLEDIYQSQNASAAIRSCECFGIHDIHIIENNNKFSVNPKVTLGSSKWLNIKKYNENDHNTLDTIRYLKSNGYRIVGTSPHALDSTLDSFDLKKGKIALLFGNELNGLSDCAMQNAEEFIRIPTVGFTESLNLSVSAAVCIYTLMAKLRNSQIDYLLSQQSKDIILHQWLRHTVKSWKSIEKRFLQNQR